MPLSQLEEASTPGAGASASLSCPREREQLWLRCGERVSIDWAALDQLGMLGVLAAGQKAALRRLRQLPTWTVKQADPRRSTRGGARRQQQQEGAGGAEGVREGPLEDGVDGREEDVVGEVEEATYYFGVVGWGFADGVQAQDRRLPERQQFVNTLALTAPCRPGRYMIGLQLPPVEAPVAAPGVTTRAAEAADASAAAMPLLKLRAEVLPGPLVAGSLHVDVEAQGGQRQLEGQQMLLDAGTLRPAGGAAAGASSAPQEAAHQVQGCVRLRGGLRQVPEGELVTVHVRVQDACGNQLHVEGGEVVLLLRQRPLPAGGFQPAQDAGCSERALRQLQREQQAAQEALGEEEVGRVALREGQGTLTWRLGVGEQALGRYVMEVRPVRGQEMVDRVQPVVFKVGGMCGVVGGWDLWDIGGWGLQGYA